MSISNQKVLKVINPFLTVLIVLQAGSGFFHSFIPSSLFEKLHGTSGLLLTVGIVVHLYLNRKWFATVYKKH